MYYHVIMCNYYDINLTKRELEVLNLVIKGYSNPKIAKELVIGLSTVKIHLDNIYKKLNVHNRVQASLAAVYYGLIEVEDIF